MASNKKFNLSKTKVCQGLNCQKALYLQIHHRDLAAPVTPAQQALFDQGREVGLKAQESYPEGVHINVPHYHPDKALEKTQKAIDSGINTLFEGAFVYDDIVIRCDILTRDSKDKPWRLHEVKSTTSLKDEHIPDIAVQKYVLESAGHKVEKCFLTHLNKECVYPDLSNLFLDVDVTNDLKEYLDILPSEITKFKEMLMRGSPPDIDIGPYCTDPYICAFKEHCWKHVPTPSIFNIPNIRTKKWELYNDGVIELSDARLNSLNDKQQTMVQSTANQTRWVDKKGLKDELDNLKYPITYLDFETIAPAIPRFDGCSPYVPEVPFQFVIYIAEQGKTEMPCIEYLHTDDKDPRQALIDTLVDSIPSEGSVVAYYKSFEAKCLRGLAEFDPANADNLISIESRLWDVMVPIKQYVYDPSFLGSFSLKSVGPALLGEKASYTDMAVSDGTEARISFAKMISDQTSKTDKQRIYETLSEYCRKDTYLMVELVNWIREQLNN